MLNGMLKTFIFVACLELSSIAGTAQEVVHALTGTVSSIDTSAKTIMVYTDNRSAGLFQDKTTSASSATGNRLVMKGKYSIIFYIGGDVRAAVRVLSLGSGPFVKDSGTIIILDDKEHSLTIKGDSGAIKSINLTPDTVAETEYGAVQGSKYRPHKGDQVRITSHTVNGSATALFINTLVAN
jgi:hypothetical protein